MTEENPFKLPTIGAQIDPSAFREGFACYEIRDQAGSVLARILASNGAHPVVGAMAGTEYWQINGTQLVMSAGETFTVVYVRGGRWIDTQPTFSPKLADFSCPIDRPWQLSSSTASYYWSHTSNTGFLIDVHYTGGTWGGSMDFYRLSDNQKLVFGPNTYDSFSKLTDTTNSRLHCSIKTADMTTVTQRLVSGSKYKLKDASEQSYLCDTNNAPWVMTISEQAKAQAHTFEKKKGEGAIQSGDTVYIKSTQFPGNYLRADLKAHPRNDARYEAGNTPVAAHEWIIKKTQETQEDPFIRVGDHVTLMNVADKKYLAANGSDDAHYVSVVDSGRCWIIG